MYLSQVIVVTFILHTALLFQVWYHNPILRWAVFNYQGAEQFAPSGKGVPHASPSPPRPYSSCSLSFSNEGKSPSPKRQRMEPAETAKHHDGLQAVGMAVGPNNLGRVSVGTVHSHEGDGTGDRLGAHVQEGEVDSEHGSMAAPNLSAVIGQLQHLFAKMQYSKGRLVLTTCCDNAECRLHRIVLQLNFTDPLIQSTSLIL